MKCKWCQSKQHSLRALYGNAVCNVCTADEQGTLAVTF